MARSIQLGTTVWAESAEIALPKGIWCGATILGPARRLHINNVRAAWRQRKHLPTIDNSINCASKTCASVISRMRAGTVADWAICAAR
jgi:hypothetical protein